MNHPLNRAAVEEMAVGIGELGLEDPTHPPPGDGVGEGKCQDANHGGEKVAKERPIEDIADEQGCKGKIAKREIERGCEVVFDNAWD